MGSNLRKYFAHELHDLHDLKQLKSSNISAIREQIQNQQNNICPLCGNAIQKPVLDHKHKAKKSDQNGPDGAGLVRGVLCSNCNQAEGKIHSGISRFGPKNISKIEFLENLIAYYKSGYYPLIHPSEEPKNPDVSKFNFNKLKKEYHLKYPKKKSLEYPKSKKLTKQLEKLFREFGIEPYNV